MGPDGKETRPPRRIARPEPRLPVAGDDYAKRGGQVNTILYTSADAHPRATENRRPGREENRQTLPPRPLTFRFARPQFDLCTAILGFSMAIRDFGNALPSLGNALLSFSNVIQGFSNAIQ